MKICMLSKHFHPYQGGLEVRVLELSRWLIEKNEQVLVLTSHELETADYEVLDGIQVNRSHVWFRLFNALFTPGVMFNLVVLDYDLIDVNLPDPVNSLFSLAASVLKSKPLVVTYHADIVKGGLMHLPFKLCYYPILWLILKRADRIFVTSPNYARSSPVLKDFMDKVEVASSFVDLRKYDRVVDTKKVRDSLGVAGKKMVLFVGRLVEYKGVKHLIDAVEGMQDVKLVVAGEGPLESSLKNKAVKLGEDVVFTGSVSDDALIELYHSCDVFVLPSINRAEAFGLVLVEAMACGKPVVSSNFSGMPYVVGDAGLVVEPADPEKLRKALSRILSDNAFASELGRKGRKRVESLFVRDVVCEKIWEVYKSTVHKK